MATCLCDAFFDEAAKASVEVLEGLGIEVVIPQAQTCCGQPAFNGGDWKSSRAVVRHTLEVFAGDDPIIVPSGSCGAMMFHGAPLEFEKEKDLDLVKQTGARTWEIFDFLYRGLGIREWTGSWKGKIAVHSSCHTRGTGTPEAIRSLLGTIEGLELVDFAEPEQCCGFGGTFSVAFPNISRNMGTLKIGNVLETQPDLLVSGDMSCLMHLKGLAEKSGRSLPAKHAIELLRDTMNESSLSYVLANH
ncbi:(Fe-S)-binding protein [Puniceicoccus vermicola]